MKEAGNVDDVDLLLSDMSYHEKTILADLERLGNVTADKEWRENAAKVCSAICTLAQSAESLTQLHVLCNYCSDTCNYRILSKHVSHIVAR